MIARDQLDLKCPRCAGYAVFVEPYVFCNNAPATGPSKSWGSWHVIERYPHLLPWQAPKGASSQYLVFGGKDGQGYSPLHRGVVECRAGCGRFIHELKWPEDAWWQWSIRGKVLWAWDRRHAQVILDYVRATHRPARSTRGWLGSLPSEFLSAKVRNDVVKAMTRSLDAP